MPMPPGRRGQTELGHWNPPGIFRILPEIPESNQTFWNRWETVNYRVAKKIKNLVTSREEALAAHELARSHMVERIKSNFVPFKKGQMVWLDSRHLKTNYYKKMAPKREGPFEIEEVLGPVTYQLKLPESWWIHKVFHATLLYPYWENKVYGENYIQPLPDIEEREEVYKVNKSWSTGNIDEAMNIWSNGSAIQ
jgi:hypothetical protein